MPLETQVSESLIELTIAEGLLILAALIAGVLVGLYAVSFATGRSLKRARKEAAQFEQAAIAQVTVRVRELELQAERGIAERRKAVDSEVSKALGGIHESQQSIAKSQATLDTRFERLTKQEQRLEARDTVVQQALAEAEQTRTRLQAEQAGVRARLEQIARMDEAQARATLLAEVRANSEHEAAELSQRIIESAEASARERGREFTLMAIQRYASDNVAESTVRTVKIPNDEVKGRIIGREGRNIRAIEKATGADILIDDTPGVIAVSCFDRVRQAIAAEVLQRLVADGRVHPSRIEEVVQQVKQDIQETIIEKGNEAALEANVRGLHPKLIEAMGRLHYRTSYGQNILRHSVEVAYLSQVIADQLGLDGAIARRCGFLHDIGKALDHEVEGPHPAIGMEFARRHGEKSEPVLNAIAGHHSDIPATTPYTPIVMAADAVSGARPGARRESMDLYVKRLQQLEAIAKEQPAVQEAYAIQAGREVRVILDATNTDDAMAFTLARDIAKRVEAEMTFPGEIKVTVLREVRAEATAR